jgi:hypothetical protein
MQVQFERWSLSTAESEVALLLIKGLALKEIALLRATSERTVRAFRRFSSKTCWRQRPTPGQRPPPVCARCPAWPEGFVSLPEGRGAFRRICMIEQRLDLGR